MSQVTNKHTMLNQVHLAMIGVQTLVVKGTDCTDSCISNYYTIMTTTDPHQGRYHLNFVIVNYRRNIFNLINKLKTD